MIINPYRHSSGSGAFDTTSFAYGGLDDYSTNANVFDTIAADPHGLNIKWSTSLWVKLDDMSSNKYLYWMHGAGNAAIAELYVISTGQVRAFMTGSGSNWSRSAAGAITLDNWHNVTMVYDSTLGRYSRQKVYVDGSLTGHQSNFYQANHVESTGIFVGATNMMGSPAGTMSGNINEMALWYGDALTQAQVQDIYNSGGPALDLEDITGLPSPTLWFRSENAVWNNSDPTDEYFLMTDEMGSGKQIRTNNMPEASRDADVPE